MNSNKCKCATYYSELIKKSGLVLPVFAALAMFAVLFYVRSIGLFAELKTVSAVGFWLFVVGAIIAIALVVTYVIMYLHHSKRLPLVVLVLVFALPELFLMSLLEFLLPRW